MMAARWDRHAEVSKAVIGARPETPARIASANGRWPTPKLETQPMPVMTTRSGIGPATVPWGVVRVNQRAAGRVAWLAAAWIAGASLLAAPQATKSGQAVDPFAEIYARGSAKQKSMRSISARFTETTTNTLLVKPLVAHGTVVAAPPARVRMTYT